MRTLDPILLIEDDNVDAMAIKRTFDELEVTNEVVHLTDGERAMEYLKNDANKKPSIILLDLNMPKMNGIEFLKIIKADDSLKLIPVVILTVSRQHSDILKGFELGTAGYIVKPTKCDDIKKILETVDCYWTLSELPQIL